MVHQPGEPIDAAWVRRQFAANNLIGQRTAADRVVALVQLINRALVQNGYINSGLLIVSTDLWRANAILDLRLVTGHISRTEVVWTNGQSLGLGEDFLLDRLPSARYRRSMLSILSVSSGCWRMTRRCAASTWTCVLGKHLVKRRST